LLINQAAQKIVKADDNTTALLSVVNVSYVLLLSIDAFHRLTGVGAQSTLGARHFCPKICV